MAGHPLIHGTDLLVLALYFVAVLAAGAWAARRSRGLADFLLGGQRFSWWLVAFSCVATVVGSYSFVKYSAAGFRHGLCSSQTYLNDWFWMPLWMLGWLPIVYWGRITSVPEYFERRFGRSVRRAATFLLLVYLLGYLGINFLTMGRALEALAGWPLLLSAGLAALVCGIYVSHGGQTAVIFTDLFQGGLLLAAGIGLFAAGVIAVGGPAAFWEGLGPAGRAALPPFREPPDFNFVGIFWQDAMAGGVAFWFLNQGILMRFLSARSVRDARRAAVFVLLVLMPLAAVAVSGAGWVGRAMAARGLLDPATPPSAVFVVVAERVLPAGLFGLVTAALVAALMSTADTLVNAIATIVLVDLWQPSRFSRGRGERAGLLVARTASAGATAAGFALVPLFAAFGSIYRAHGAFTAAITPPLAVALLLGITWRRFGRAGALATLAGGTAAIALSFAFPGLVTPFAHGVRLEAGVRAYTYVRALYGLVVSAALGIGVTLLRPAPAAAPPAALLVAPAPGRLRAFKGADPHPGPGPARRLAVVPAPDPAPADPWTPPEVGLHPADLRALEAEGGDLILVARDHPLLGGWQGFRGRARVDGRVPRGTLRAPEGLLRRLGLDPGCGVRVFREL